LAVIVTCFDEQGWTGTRIGKEFPNKKWDYRSQVFAKYRYTGTTDRKEGSGRPVTAMTDGKLAEVQQLCQSQHDRPETHNSQREAARIIGVSRRSVQRMLKRRGLHPFKRMRTSAVNHHHHQVSLIRQVDNRNSVYNVNKQ